MEDRYLLATLTVNSALDNTAAGDGLVTLREAILAANADGTTDLGETGSGADTIVFDPVVFATPQSILMSLGEFQISQALTIDGPGRDNLTINGQILSRLFNVTATSGVVTLEGMKLTGGKAPGNGGAIRLVAANAELVVDSSTISGNSAVGEGGGIHAVGKVTIKNSTITNNTGTGTVGRSISGRVIDIVDSTLGGGVYATNKIELVDSTVLDNGIRTSNTGTAIITGSGIAGGVEAGAEISIKESTVTGSISGIGNVTIEDLVFSGGDIYSLSDVLINQATIQGSVSSKYGNVTISSATISGGDVSTNYFYINLPFVTNSVTLKDSSVLGGGINSRRNVTLINSTVTGNTGPGIEFFSGTVRLTSSTVSGHTGTGILMTSTNYRYGGRVELVDSHVDNNLGGIVVRGGIVTVASSTVSGNQGRGILGESVYSPYQVGSLKRSDVSIAGSVIADNGGAGIDTQGLVQVNLSHIDGNGHASGGGGIVGRFISATGSTVSENVENSAGSTRGGGITGDSVVLRDTTVSSNSTVGHGGAIRAKDSLSLTNSTISGNSSVGSGGGIWIESGDATIQYSTIANNQAAVGGGLWSGNGNATTIAVSIIAGNSASTSNPDLRLGSMSPSIKYSLIGNKAGTSLTEAQVADANGNLIGNASGGGVIDPKLGPLADNGGLTKTHALLAGSPAIDAKPYVHPPGVAETAVHVYELNGSLADANGGPNLSPLGGTLTASGYLFGPNQGLNLFAPDIDPDEYSIEIRFTWSALSGGWQKIVDFHDLAVDQGVYTLGNGLQFLNEAFTDNLVSANSPIHLVLTRDAATDVVRAFIGGNEVWSFVDNSGLATLNAANTLIRFFQDDLATGQTEAQSGFVDSIRIFDRVLTNAEITQLANPTPPAGPPATDQRGYPYQRVVDGNGVGGAQIDMGAFEWQQFTPAALPGDYNLDGTVNAADYTVWRDRSGLMVPPYSSADGDGNGIVDEADYGVWKANFGQSLPAAGSGGIASLVEPLAATTVEEGKTKATDQEMDVPAIWFVATATERDRADVVSGGAASGGNARHDLALLAWLTTLDADLGGNDSDGKSGPIGLDEGADADGDLCQSLELAFEVL